MPKRLMLFVGAIFVFAGCSTPREHENRPSDFVVTNTMVPPPPPAPVKTNPPMPVAEVTAVRSNEFSETWISVDEWAEVRELGAVKQISSPNGRLFKVETPLGEAVFQPNSHVAYWNNIQLYLGFAPRLKDGELYIHRLDLIKNLDPLLNKVVMEKTNCVVVIDPGHGGLNPGTQSVADGKAEKEFTLDWALRLASVLKTNGWQVFLTRTNDVDVSLGDRVAFADQCEADLFISLHFNSAAPDQRETGLETYCLTPTGMASMLTRNYPDNVTQVFPNNSYDAQSWAAAFQVHQAVVRAGLLEDRGLRRARFMGVLRGQKRPAFLIEGGYLSNPAEAKRIADPAFRQSLAEAVAAGLK